MQEKAKSIDTNESVKAHLKETAKKNVLDGCKAYLLMLLDSLKNCNYILNKQAAL